MTRITAAQVAKAIEEIAPLQYQESYDNAGFCIGNPQSEVTAALLCLDVTEAVLDEALSIGANLIISHHPVIFKGLKHITGRTAVERIVEKAIKNNLILYAAHTNIDSIYNGVSGEMAQKLGLQNTQILSPRKNEWLKLITFVPHAHADAVRNTLFEAGAGGFGNYSQCSWNVEGKGTFVPKENANPFIGTKNALHTEPETRIETIVPRALLSTALTALRNAHPYEEPAYDIVPLENTFTGAGFGIIGDLPEALSNHHFLQKIKKVFGTPFLRYSSFPADKITRVAMCGGSGAFLLNEAASAGATAYISADFKFHDFFDADNRLMIVDIGHYESEIGVLNVFYDCLTKKLTNFAVHFTKNTTNAVNYF